jgi:hypothetical protein
VSTHPLAHPARNRLSSQDRRSRRSGRVRARRIRTHRLWLIAAAAAIALALVVVFVTGGSSSTSNPASTGAAADPASAVARLAAIPIATLGQAAMTNRTIVPPTSITASPLTSAGKPLVLYIGAEYCPFCASERWAVVTALAKFGQWNNLGATHSGSSDVYPNTATFSFVGATYTSTYLSFQGVELQSNVKQGSGYAALQMMTSEQSKLLQTYDAPPYVSANSNQAIPWVDYGGSYISSGSSFDPGLLAGMNLSQIAAEAGNQNSSVGQSISAAAGAIVARLCVATRGQPGSVCNA